MRPLLLLLAAAAALPAQVATEANRHYRTPESRAAAARNLAAPERPAALRILGIIQAAGIKPGMTVADVGTGAGGMLPALAAAVAPGGRILAEDIFPDLLDRARKLSLADVTFILGTERDPRLPAQCCDVALVIDAYHHFDYPAAMLAGLRAGLRPGGRLVIVDYYRRAGAMAGCNAAEHVRLDAPGVVTEVAAHGFRLVSQAEHVPGSQYIAIFEPTAPR